MDTLEFLLDVPPSTNHLYRTLVVPGNPPRVTRVKTTAYKKWQKHAWGECHPDDKERYSRKPRWRWQLYIVANINFTKDVSNLIKPAEDTLAEYLGLKDAYTMSICAERRGKTLEGTPLAEGKCKVYIYVLGG